MERIVWCLVFRNKEPWGHKLMTCASVSLSVSYAIAVLVSVLTSPGIPQTKATLPIVFCSFPFSVLQF